MTFKLGEVDNDLPWRAVVGGAFGVFLFPRFWLWEERGEACKWFLGWRRGGGRGWGSGAGGSWLLLSIGGVAIGVVEVEHYFGVVVVAVVVLVLVLVVGSRLVSECFMLAVAVTTVVWLALLFMLASLGSSFSNQSNHHVSLCQHFTHITRSDMISSQLVWIKTFSMSC